MPNCGTEATGLLHGDRFWRVYGRMADAYEHHRFMDSRTFPIDSWPTPRTREVVKFQSARPLRISAHVAPGAFRTRKKRISGELYDVLDGGSGEVIRSRGLARKVEQELAETTLKVTTASRRGN